MIQYCWSTNMYLMNYYSTHKPFFVFCYSSDVEQYKKIDKFLDLLSRSGACKIIENEIKKEDDKGGRRPVNPYNLLASIIYCFAFKKGTLREIETELKFDLRLKYIMQDEEPSYKTIGNFINKFIIPNQNEIFKLITFEIFKECKINMDKVFIDGSKFVANANKYKFVWKPTTFHKKLSEKIRILLKKYDLDRSIPTEGIIESKTVAKKLEELSDKFSEFDLSLKENRKYSKDLTEMTNYLNKSLEYEEKERICGPDRNSFYKTDYDATAMCTKEDYYSGLGSNMHAAYNIQICVSYGFVTTFYVSQNRADLYDFVPTLKKFYEKYGFYPKSVCADAGYGSDINYSFMKNNNIKSFVKYFSWEGNASGRNPSQYVLNEDETITCLNGNIGFVFEENTTHHRKKNSTFYKIEGCLDCNFSTYCKRFMSEKNKNTNFKIFEVTKQLQQYIQESEKNLLSIEGIEMRVNRSIQVEGVFGIIKQNFGYERIRRRSIKKVSGEFMLICLGANIRKLFKFYNNDLKLEFWKIPSNAIPETFKQPSAKRLSNKASKKKKKSLNDQAKEIYKKAK